MNTGKYYTYIVNSQYYRNLTTAKTLISEISGDVDELILALNDASGTIIDEMSTELKSLKSQLAEYSTMVDSIKSDLRANATLFDSAYNNWRGKIGTEVESGYLCDGVITKTILPGTPEDYRHPKAFKYSMKIDDVSIDPNDNYIYITYKTYHYGYEIKNPGWFESVGFSDILQEKNRNKEIDFSRVFKVKVNFMNKNFAPTTPTNILITQPSLSPGGV